MSRTDTVPRKVSAAFPGVRVTTPRVPSTAKAVPEPDHAPPTLAVPHDPLTTRLKESAMTAVAVGPEVGARTTVARTATDTSTGMRLTAPPAALEDPSSHPSPAVRSGPENSQTPSWKTRLTQGMARCEVTRGCTICLMRPHCRQSALTGLTARTRGEGGLACLAVGPKGWRVEQPRRAAVP